MKITHTIAKSVLLVGVLSSCGTLQEPQYTDNDLLERPPAIAIDRQATPQQEVVAPTETPQKLEKGLGADVSISKDSPLQITIHRPFDGAWHDVEVALKQLDFEVTDREHDKGLYYVNYDADDYQPEDNGFLDKSMSFFKNDYKQSVYVLTVEELGGETRVIASIANDAEQTNHGALNDKAGQANLTEGADRLLLTLYRNLHDKLVED